jgi:hypothetical protein
MNALKLNGKQVAETLGVSDSFIFNLVKQGLIPCLAGEPGARFRIDAAWVAQLASELGPIATGEKDGNRAFAVRRILTTRAIRISSEASVREVATSSAIVQPVASKPQQLPLPTPIRAPLAGRTPDEVALELLQAALALLDRKGGAR